MKASPLHTNEGDVSVQLSNRSLSSSAFDLGTVAASPSSFPSTLLAPRYFFIFQTILYSTFSSQRNAGMGAVSMETHFRPRQYL